MKNDLSAGLFNYMGNTLFVTCIGSGQVIQCAIIQKYHKGTLS